MKVRALGRPEIEHLAQMIRESRLIIVQVGGSNILAKDTVDIIAEALEEFALTVTEP